MVSRLQSLYELLPRWCHCPRQTFRNFSTLQLRELFESWFLRYFQIDVNDSDGAPAMMDPWQLSYAEL